MSTFRKLYFGNYNRDALHRHEILDQWTDDLCCSRPDLGALVGMSKLQPCCYEELGDRMGSAVSFLEKQSQGELWGPKS